MTAEELRAAIEKIVSDWAYGCGMRIVDPDEIVNDIMVLLVQTKMAPRDKE